MRARLLPSLALGLLFALVGATSSMPARAVPVYQIIVNGNNSTAGVDRKFIEEAFLKKTTRWPDDSVIKPADLAPGSAVRRKFSEEMLNRSVETVKGYWQQKIFSGRDVPPPEFDSDADVVRYVQKHDGAIGYVSGGADIGGARVLAVR